MAEKVIELANAATEPALVLVHDYQLYLVPRLVREAVPNALIQHFIHVPWPTPQYWKVLPKHMRSDPRRRAGLRRHRLPVQPRRAQLPPDVCGEPRPAGR